MSRHFDIVRVDIGLTEFVSFMRDAKGATFAGSGRRTKTNMFRFYRFARNEWAYEDRYTGNLFDTGMEVIRYRKYPIWAMVYRGGVIEEHQTLSGILFSFLKEALKRAPMEMPVRGPAEYRAGDFIYKNVVRGSLLDFEGCEEICLNDIRLYYHRYQGGVVRDRRYVVSFL